MEYVISKALCPIYKEPCDTAEYVDEAFFGQTANVTERKQGFCLLKTDYGYSGWAREDCLSSARYEPTHIVTSAFGDMLYEPKNGRRAVMDLPRGSKVRLLPDGGTERYAAVEATDGGVYYLHRKNLLPLSSLGTEKDVAKKRRAITDVARLFLGTGYRWGGKTAAGIDCSGLAFMSYYMNGLTIYRDAVVERSPLLRKIAPEQAAEGDLLFFPGHVAIYIKDGLFIHSTTALGGVGFNSLNEESPLYSEALKNTLTAVATAF